MSIQLGPWHHLVCVSGVVKICLMPVHEAIGPKASRTKACVTFTLQSRSAFLCLPEALTLECSGFFQLL